MFATQFLLRAARAFPSLLCLRLFSSGAGKKSRYCWLHSHPLRRDRFHGALLSRLILFTFCTLHEKISRFMCACTLRIRQCFLQFRVLSSRLKSWQNRAPLSQLQHSEQTSAIAERLCPRKRVSGSHATATPTRTSNQNSSSYLLAKEVSFGRVRKEI